MADDDLPDLVGRLIEFSRSPRAINRAVYVVLGLCVLTVLVSLVTGPETAAQIGDSFGALGTLFSGFALLGVFVAVMLQHEELKLAREDAKSSEAARLKAEKLMARQADVLLATARLNAANAIREASSEVPHSFNNRGQMIMVPFKKVMTKYLNIILLSVSDAEPNPEASPPEGLSMYRKYMMHKIQETKVMIVAREEYNRGETVTNLRILHQEFIMILCQSGIAGSLDAELAEGCLKVLEGLGITKSPTGDHRTDGEHRRDVEKALSSIEDIASGRAIPVI
jgi:hypothetical protein